MRRLARDKSGNTLAIMAMALIPLAGIIGGAVDVSRMYLTKARLQQACDAGALAGRKVMGGGSWSADSNAANTAAEKFFDANFKWDSATSTGAYGTLARTRSFAESSGKVTGTASAQVPMTVMKIFRQTTKTISVTCDAEMRIPNTDVMFVLDVTGSMGETIPGDTGTKIDGMHRAVKCFYEILAKLDIDDENCGSTPSGGVGGQVQVRFGFVPYSTNVNVGKLLPASYFAQNWTYQSRTARYTTGFYPVVDEDSSTYWEYYTGSTAPYTSTDSAQATGVLTDDQCERFMDNLNITTNNGSTVLFAKTPETSGGPPPATEYESEFDNDGNASGGNNGEWGWNGAPDTGGNTRSCRRRRTDNVTDYSDTIKYKFTDWTYAPISYDVSSFVAGNTIPVATSNNGYVSNSGTYNMVELASATGATGISTTQTTWDGCIEERPTAKGTTDFDPIPATAYDLNIDLVPSSGNANSLWGPIWNRLHYSRKVGAESWWATKSWDPVVNTTNAYDNDSGYSCAPEARLLQEWNTASDFKNYVNTLQPTSNTYHDIGLLWGARLMSPTGIFAAQNATTPEGGSIERHLIFMTDGTAVASTMNQTAYGVGWYDRRQMETTDNAVLKTQIEERMSGLCTAVKNKNITLWVIYFGDVSGPDATRMSACATTGRYYVASNNASLITTFQSIAAQISNLRLTQ